MKISQFKYWAPFAIIIIATFLRFFQLSLISPYWEEVALGYDSYSILQTGKDHHGNIFPIVAFESFGDFKPSLYFYSLVPSLFIFGLNTFAVRFPSALFGVLTVLIVFLFTKELLQDQINQEKKQSQKKEGSTLPALMKFVPSLSALFLAIMPWHIMISRTGFETNLGLFLVTSSAWMFLKGKNYTKKAKINYWWIGDIILASLSLYAYHGYRVFTPLILFLFCIIFWKKLWQKKAYLIFAAFIFFVFIIPIGQKMKDPVVTQRFAETSAFAALDPILKSNEAIAKGGGGLIPKLIHHRYRYYGEIFIVNYLSHFTPDFLFFSGDGNPRHSIPITGQLYVFQFPLVIMGLIFTISNKKFRKIQAPIIFGWLLIAPIASGVTKTVPHALRSLPMVIPLSILSGIGLIYSYILVQKYIKILLKRIKRGKIILTYIPISYVSIFAIVALFELVRFWEYYQTDYLINYSQDWQYGYQQAVQYIKENKQNYDTIIFTRNLGRPAMYYWFFSKTEPKIVQQWDHKSPKDQGEYLQFENIYFGITPKNPGKNLEITNKFIENKTLLKQINNLNNTPALYIYE